MAYLLLGFLQRSPNKIRKELRAAARADSLIVFFESPYRVRKTLELAAEVLGEDCPCFIGREMTKKFEEFLSGTLEEVAMNLKNRETLGEFTVMIKP